MIVFMRINLHNSLKRMSVQTKEKRNQQEQHHADQRAHLSKSGCVPSSFLLRF